MTVLKDLGRAAAEVLSRALRLEGSGEAGSMYESRLTVRQD